ncbi:hypothetical protein [Streptomyces sp. CAU 1734]|uniref:hypothetical protein n=1 Tax=Streptomyces sp. CAU 1734 TaxID=3140360 RepID=UPI003260D888
MRASAGEREGSGEREGPGEGGSGQDVGARRRRGVRPAARLLAVFLVLTGLAALGPGQDRARAGAAQGAAGTRWAPTAAGPPPLSAAGPASVRAAALPSFRSERRSAHPARSERAGFDAAAKAAACSGTPRRILPFATGELRIYKNSRYACAVTLARNPGPRRHMSVSIQARGGRPSIDSGVYRSKAGPRTVYSLGRCVRATGKVAGSHRSSGWILC